MYIDLSSTCRELSNDDLGFFVALPVHWQIIFRVFLLGVPSSCIRVGPSPFSLDQLERSKYLVLGPNTIMLFGNTSFIRL